MQNTSENMNTWTDGIIVHWKSKNINLQKGASLEKILNIEKNLDLIFDNHLKYFIRR